MHYFFQSESEVVDSPSGSETESTSPSEYSGDEDKLGNNSNSSSSSDTDIDAAVTEYRKTAPVAAVSTIGGGGGGLDAGRQQQSGNGGGGGPTTTSVKRVKVLLALLVGSLYAQFVILESLKSSAYSTSSVGLNLATSLVIFYIILTMSQEPQCSGPQTRQTSKLKAFLSTLGWCCTTTWRDASYGEVESGECRFLIRYMHDPYPNF